VIVLDQPGGNTSSFNVVFWADVPAARQTYYADPNLTSQWKGAVASDNTALQNGSVVELMQPHVMPPGTTLAQVQNYLAAQWQNYQTSISNYNPWIRYGSTWDGTTWTVLTNG
jgi:hypothetical protein